MMMINDNYYKIENEHCVICAVVFMLQSMDKSFQNAKSKVSQVEVLKVAAHTDKPLYMLSKKEIDELMFSKREK